MKQVCLFWISFCFLYASSDLYRQLSQRWGVRE
jgi:hypothetical protein